MEPLGSILRERVFAGMGASDPPVDRIGVEVELLPRRLGSGDWVPVDGLAGSMGILERGLAGHGWRRYRSESGVPGFRHPAAGVITFEPGGQLEYSSLPAHTLAELRREVDRVIGLAAAAYGEAGIELVGTGVDPLWPADRIPLQLRSPRYRHMADYLDSRSAAGTVMMRASAAIHVHVDTGGRERAMLRWRAAHRLVPVLTAVFGNSPIVAGRRSGWRSTRARLWRELDPGRTDFVAASDDPAEEYGIFASRAHYIFARDGEAYRPLDHWIREGAVGVPELESHLSTLFPDVRPRGHLEIRSIDALPVEWWSVPVFLVTALLYDDRAARACLDVLGPPSLERVAMAGFHGLEAPGLLDEARAAFDLAVRAARGDRSGRFAPADIERAEAFFERFTGRGSTPGDELAGPRMPEVLPATG